MLDEIDEATLEVLLAINDELTDETEEETRLDIELADIALDEAIAQPILAPPGNKLAPAKLQFPLIPALGVVK